MRGLIVGAGLVVVACGGGADDGGGQGSGSTAASTASEPGGTSGGEATQESGGRTAGTTTSEPGDTTADASDTTTADDTTTDSGPQPSGSGSIEFFGNGGLYGDRVLITLDDPDTVDPGPAVDVGNEDFTIELWIRPDVDANANPMINCGATNDWVSSNIVVDRDRHSQPPSFGVGIAGGVMVWAVQGEAGDPWSMCGTASVLDGNWHHIAVQRRRSDGWLWLFVDGVLDAEVDGPDGDISYPDDGVPMDVCPGGVCDYSDPFLAIGAEKHGYESISYTGLVDELRVSTTLRYSAEGFEIPGEPFTPDDDTAGLYHFDDGSGEVATDASDNASNGQLVLGGRPEGPLWADADPWR